jgi:hypothetical protein
MFHRIAVAALVIGTPAASANAKKDGPQPQNGRDQAVTSRLVAAEPPKEAEAARQEAEALKAKEEAAARAAEEEAKDKAEQAAKDKAEAAAGQEKPETRKALTILLLDADIRGISKGINQIEFQEDKDAKKVHLADAVASPPPQGSDDSFKRVLGDLEMTDPKREWVMTTAKLTMGDGELVEGRVLSLRDMGKTTIKLQRSLKTKTPKTTKATKAASFTVTGLPTLKSSRLFREKPAFSDKGDWTFYVHMAEYDELVPKRNKP